MSPQLRATTKNTTLTFACGDGQPCNSCSVAMYVAAELDMAADMSSVLHKIESESSTEESLSETILATIPNNRNPLLSQDDTSCLQAASARKRHCAEISSEDPTEPPSLLSYGSAFLSGIFADIAQASGETGAFNFEPNHKRSRIMNARLSFGRQSKSFDAASLAGRPSEGADSEALMPSVVVSPRSNEPNSNNIHHFRDPVRELQDMAFPSLPHIPEDTLSSSSSSFTSILMAASVTCRGNKCSNVTEVLDKDSPSEYYGWFVSTDDDDVISALVKERAMSASTGLAFDLAFKVRPASRAEGAVQETEVQQALAADMIDDVLGDFF